MRRPGVVLGLCLLASCASPARQTPLEDGSRLDRVPLFNPETVLEDAWQHLVLNGKTEYRLVAKGSRVAIRAVGTGSASGLIRRVSVDPSQCPVFEWSWSVSKLQAAADLTSKDREDVAASVFLLFGDPGFLFDPKPVPTIRYVWTNDKAAAGDVIDNPYLPGVVRSIVVERGAVTGGIWVTERRNVREDYRQAFGASPDAAIRAVVLFTDNDQTNEPVEAYYGAGHALCGQ